MVCAFAIAATHVLVSVHATVSGSCFNEEDSHLQALQIKSTAGRGAAGSPVVMIDGPCDLEYGPGDEPVVTVNSDGVTITAGGSDGYCVNNVKFDGVVVKEGPFWLDQPCGSPKHLRYAGIEECHEKITINTPVVMIDGPCDLKYGPGDEPVVTVTSDSVTITAGGSDGFCVNNVKFDGVKECPFWLDQPCGSPKQWRYAGIEECHEKVTIDIASIVIEPRFAYGEGACPAGYESIDEVSLCSAGAAALEFSTTMAVAEEVSDCRPHGCAAGNDGRLQLHAVGEKNDPDGCCGCKSICVKTPPPRFAYGEGACPAGYESIDEVSLCSAGAAALEFSTTMAVAEEVFHCRPH